MWAREPAILIGAIMSLIALAVSFGLKISGEQINLINTFLIAATPLIGGIAIRSQVVPTEKANSQIMTAVKMSPESKLHQVIAKNEKEANL